VIRTTDRPVRAVYSTFGIVSVLGALTACGGQYNPFTGGPAVDTQTSSTLQFRVGTARFADGTAGLNTVVTFRSTSGTSATTIDTPTITGPTGFVVPDNPQTDPSPDKKNTDVGTNKISGTPSGGTTLTTFGTAGGAFAYGFANINASIGTNGFAQFVNNVADNTALYQDADSPIVVGSGKGNVENIIGTAALGGPKVGAIANSYPDPLFAAETLRLPFLLGPPAVANFHNANFSSAFLGYESGFTAFAATPVAGSYSLTVVVPATVQQSAATFTSAANLASVAPLGAESTAVVIASTGDGGAQFTVAAPPAGVTTQLLYVVDVSAKTANPTMYTIPVNPGGTFSLSATSGPNLTGTPGPPFAVGDSIYAYLLGADYDIVASAPPANVDQAPALPAQADITISKVTEVVYPKLGVTGPLFHRLH